MPPSQLRSQPCTCLSRLHCLITQLQLLIVLRLIVNS